MPTTPLLGITQVSTSQNGKETTINDAIMALESAANATLAVSLAAGDVTLSVAEATRNFIFAATGATTARELLFPIEVNGNPFNRVFTVRNESGHNLTVRFATGAGSTVTIPNGVSLLLNGADGSDITVAAELPSAFTDLIDTPVSYTGQGGKLVRVNDLATGLEFVTATDDEAIRDVIGTALVAGTNVTITVNDPGNTITINATTDQEVVRDTVATALVAGANITITNDDVANTITIAAAGSSDPETVRDIIGTALVAGANITITVDDPGDTITIAADGVSSLAALMDVDVTSTPPLAGQALVYDDVTNKWEPGTVSGGGGGGSTFLPVSTITGTAYDLLASNAGGYLRFTAVTNKVVNVRTQADHALPADSEWHFRNVGAENLTITPAVGVTITPPTGGSLVVPPAGVVTLKRTTADNFDLLGTTISATGGTPYSIPFGFVPSPLGDQTLLIHVFAEAVSFAGDFALAQGTIGTNPTANADLSIRKNGVAVGGILVTTAGAVSFFSTGGGAVSFDIADVLTVVFQDPADLTLANSAFTLRGSRT